MKKIINFIQLILLFLILNITIILFVTFNYYIKNEKVDTTYMWNINFNNLQISEGSKESNINIEDNNLNIEVELKQKEYLEFFVDITNKGSLDAIIKNINFNSENNTENLKYYLSYDDGTEIKKGDELNSNEYKTIKVRIEYPEINKKTESSNLKIDLSIDLEAK